MCTDFTVSPPVLCVRPGLTSFGVASEQGMAIAASEPCYATPCKKGRQAGPDVDIIEMESGSLFMHSENKSICKRRPQFPLCMNCVQKCGSYRLILECVVVE
eukprot:scaffold200865_cov18-Tisochrysis_lutea.AAC.2